MLESHQVRPDIAAQPALARHRKQLVPERLGDIRGQAGKPSSTLPMTASKPAKEADSDAARHATWA